MVESVPSVIQTKSCWFKSEGIYHLHIGLIFIAADKQMKDSFSHPDQTPYQKHGLITNIPSANDPCEQEVICACASDVKVPCDVVD